MHYLRTVFAEAFRELGRNKIRSALTILGIAVGIAAFICVVAIGDAGSAKIEEQLHNLGDNMIWIEAGSRAKSGVRVGSRGSRTLIVEDALSIERQIRGIKQVVPNVDGRMQAVYGNLNWGTQYRGVTPGFLEVRRWDVRLGGFFSREDVERASPVCVIGQTVVDNLFGQENPIGKTIRLNNLPCSVIGVFAAKGVSSTGQDQDDFIVLPYTTVQKRLTGTFWLDDIFVSAASADTMQPTSQEIIGLLRERHHLRQGEPDDFNLRTPEELIRAQLQASHLLTLLLASTASLSLLVGGVGIMNIMLVSITQRTREIGIRMAIGATEGDVQLQFLSEAVIISMLGGILGVIVGILASSVLQNTLHWQLQLSPQIMVFASLFAAGTGIFFGYYPSRKAAQLNPIESLRYE
ncbi:MAG: multidrug ABC transporter substrate-binding protein [Candidatus Angelobacter sp. Gp1-AA117]|nr:MAG: multidrug ABC transporter substrate-binding protein [Candidatus Angelobacter sp. Gp1-AA117]